MTFNELIIKQFPVQTSNPFIKGLFIISTFFDAVIIVDVTHVDKAHIHNHA